MWNLLFFFVSFCTEEDDVQELAPSQVDVEAQLVRELNVAAEDAKVNEGEYIHIIFPVLNSLYLSYLFSYKNTKKYLLPPLLLLHDVQVVPLRG